MDTKNGLIVVNSNCNPSNYIDIIVQKIHQHYNTELIYSKNQDELTNEFDNQDYVIVVGGDGTIFSIVQLIFEKNIVIGHLPCGTGNGLTNSLIYDTNITIDFKMESLSENLISAIDENRIREVDTMTINMLKSNKKIHSFIFISCGIFSNLDVGMDSLRFLGEFRYTLGAIYELLKYIIIGNSFNGKLEYEDFNEDIIKVEGKFIFFMANNISHTSRSTITSPLSNVDDGYIYLSYLTEPSSIQNVLKILLGLEDGSFINHLTYVRTNWFKFEPEDGVYDIDGEKFPIEPIEVRINPKSLKILI